MNENEQIILVDEADNEIGFCEKLEAHQKGVLHRAFSVFIFNSNHELLLQKRAETKYHSGGLWTNTCCSHPLKGENTEEAVYRRLKEEMGITSQVGLAFSFIYKADMGNGLIEHELDHVYFGFSDDLPVLNHNEASDYKYISAETLKEELINHPDQFTAWLKICFSQVDLRWPRK